MKAANSIALPIVELVKRTTIKFGGWKGPIDFVVVKMDDFDVVLGMEFLHERPIIPMSSAKCLVITRPFPTVVQADIRQPNRFKMISAMQIDKSPAQEEPPSVAILLGALGKLGETVFKDILRTDHRTELPVEAKAPAKNPYCTTPPELTILRKQSKKLLGTRVSRPVQAPWGTPVLSLKKKDRNLQWCINRRIQNKLTVRRRYSLLIPTNLFNRPCGVKYFSKSDIRPSHCRGGNLKCQAALNGLKQATIEGPSFGVTDATKHPKVKAEQFNCMLGEYLHHLVDGRQKNWVQLLNVAQFDHSSQTDSLTKRSQFEISYSRHFVLSLLTSGPYVGNNPQIHRVEKEWEQMADIARVCLEEASRPMEERVNQN
ncbi:uncharacterized protein E6C27_scaffold114G001140 [Cucumis melo var. makuwa]|uniref:Reverse transcriptase n=1 Tax=Cucumis melo var. makuwa TaxID=1194695 RepID=A0A5A7TZ32_CUCMM|nr:uncharacterized protein E6C27_scaffold114G001140 [Cucumis melo var. makuwa]